MSDNRYVATGRLPTFLIVGAMRCGTSSLAHYLRGHPQVALAEQKEVHFFDAQFARGADWYRNQFIGAGSALAVGEATPNYMFKPEVPARMAALVPDARLIAILRDPIDRAYSHFRHNVARGREPLTFDEALAAERERQLPSRDRHDYLRRGHYLPQLQRLCEHYPRESLLVLLFEDLVADPRKVFGELCAFIEVDDSYRPPVLGTPVNATQGFRSLAVRRWAKPLPRRLRNAVGRVNRRAHPQPPLDPGHRAELRASLASERDALAEWLGRDLTPWAT